MSERLGDDAARLRAMDVDPAPVERAALAVLSGLAGGGKVLTFGNGGSAADAQHFAAELVGRFESERPAIPAIALTTDTSALTAIANDYGFERVFARQVEALGRPGDVAIGFSTSGTSANVLAAIDAANEAGLTTIGFCGRPGCPLCERVDVAIAVDRATDGRRPGGPPRDRALDLPDRRAGDLGRRRSTGAGKRRHARRAARAPGGLGGGRADRRLDERRLRRPPRRTPRRAWTAAAALGDVLVVGVNSRRRREAPQGRGRPLVPEAERASLLASLRVVDHVLVFSEDTPEQVLAAVRPDVHCKGEDYRPPDGKPVPERSLVESYGGRVEFLPLLPGRSTTGLVERLSGD